MKSILKTATLTLLGFGLAGCDDEQSAEQSERYRESLVSDDQPKADPTPKVGPGGDSSADSNLMSVKVSGMTDPRRCVQRVRSALSGLELDNLKVQVGSVTYTGDTEAAKVVEAINSKTEFTASLE